METRQNCKRLNNCLCCRGQNLELFLWLKYNPPCNRLVAQGEPQPPSFPLALNVCTDCLHQQLSHAVDADVLFSKYPYRTGYSVSHRRHFSRLASYCLGLPFKNEDDQQLRIADVGGNDGTLLSCMRDRQRRVQVVERWSIDPFVVPDKGSFEHHLTDRFDLPVENIGVQFDLMTATNVLAHNSNPKQFILNCCNHLKTDGFLVVESPCSFQMIENMQFDTVYHEHFSYFNVSSMAKLVEGFPLEIFSIEHIEGHHGRTVRFVLRKVEEDFTQHNKEYMEAFAQEISLFDNINVYEAFQARVDHAKRCMEREIWQARERGDLIIGFGASAKAVTTINFFGGGCIPDFIVDETPAKAGKFTPKSNVPIRSYHIEKENYAKSKPLRNVLFILYTWNCLDESLDKMGEFVKDADRRSYISINDKRPVKF